MTAVKRATTRLEKFEQADGLRLLQSLGGRVFVSGTVRVRPNPSCPSCLRNQSTRQTPGIPDVEVFLPPPRKLILGPRRDRLLKWEVKRVRGKLSPEQARYRDLCELAGVAHVSGPLDALIGWLVAEGYLSPDQLTASRRASVLLSEQP